MDTLDSARLAWPNDDGEPASELYLELLKRVLTGIMRPKDIVPAEVPLDIARTPELDSLLKTLESNNLTIAEKVNRNLQARIGGVEWIPDGETMVGLHRLDNVHYCIRSIIEDRIPGDLIETGVWRGGTCIFMRACLKAYGDVQRSVWVADSFCGLPPPSPGDYPADSGDVHFTYEQLAISQLQVEQNFQEYGMLDDRVKFLKGWFKDTLPSAPIDKLAVLRLDGDMYESTMDSLSALYDKVSVGGFIIIDDYLWHKPCAQATEDFRSHHGITESIVKIDQAGVFWRREK